MSDPAVLIAIREHLQAIPNLPTIFLPNQIPRVSSPFLTFDNGVTFNTPLTIDGEEFFELRPQISLHEQPGTFTADGDATLWAIAQAFKFGTRIYSGATEVGKCLRTPVSDNGMEEGGVFRRNMILRIASYQQI